jgi:general L-amino acid transport system substrate-binding protein
MVPADSGITSLEDLADANICVLSGTTTELNLTAVFNTRGMPFNPTVFADNTALRPAYEQGQCEAWTSDVSQLTAFKAAIEGEGGAAQLILPDVISKEPLGPSCLDGDSAWAQAVEWSVMATVQAWEFGITSSNVASFDTSDASVRNFLNAGDEDFEVGLGLDPDFAKNIISQVGNYEEIYNTHLVPIGLPLAGTPNDLWTQGGLMYAPPYR